MSATRACFRLRPCALPTTPMFSAQRASGRFAGIIPCLTRQAGAQPARIQPGRSPIEVRSEVSLGLLHQVVHGSVHGLRAVTIKASCCEAARAAAALLLGARNPR